MASVFKRTYTTTDPKTGKKVKRKTKKWYGKYRDADGILHRVPLCTDKDASEAMLHELRVKAERRRHGLGDSFDSHRKRPITDHLADFIQSLRDTGRTDDYVGPVESRCRRIIESCKFRFIDDISASRVQSLLAGLKKDGLGQRTINHYLAAIKQFSRWLLMDRRTDENRLAHLKGNNAKMDVRRERRELTEEELKRLLDTARNCRRKGFSLSGHQRFLLYSVALGTGLRASELASLTPKHFDLDAEPPIVQIEAPDEKSRRGGIIPLPLDLVEILRPVLQKLRKNDPIWPGKWAENKRAGKFLQSDLKAARKAWIEEAENDSEKQAREQSDFLAYRDAEGRQADFHALRHTYLSRLGRSGANPKVMQKLARHTTVELTLGRYTHADVSDLVLAVQKLPALPIRVPAAGNREGKSSGDTGPKAYSNGQGQNEEFTGPKTGLKNGKTGPKLARTADRRGEAMSAGDASRVGKSPSQEGGDKSLESSDLGHGCPPLAAVGKEKREWMGIEPTRRLFSRHTGFEAQGGHQIRVHSRIGKNI